MKVFPGFSRADLQQAPTQLYNQSRGVGHSRHRGRRNHGQGEESTGQRKNNMNVLVLPQVEPNGYGL